MLLSLAAAVLVSALVAASATEVPSLDLGTSCRAVENHGLTGGRTVETCRRSETDARDQLSRQWAQFPAADKTRCTQIATMGGVHSYVEPLTCLEIARDVRALRNANPGSTTGQGP